MRRLITLLLLCLFFNLIPIQSMKLCLVKTQAQKKNPPYQIHEQQELRSYKPHFLNSFSYPNPISPLIYYGQVKDNKPIFFFKDRDNSQKKAEEIFFINGQASTPYSAQTFLLRKQRENVNRFMLVVQVQNLFQDKQVNSSIYLMQKGDFYLFIVEYQNQFKAYQLFFVQEGKNIQKIQELNKFGLKISIRNQSAMNNKQTWKLAQQLFWHGQSNATLQNEQTHFTGVVMQMEFQDKDKLDQTQIHLKEVKRKHYLQSKEQFIKRIGNYIDAEKLPKIIFPKKQTCAQAAVTKLFGGLTYEYGTLELRNGSQVLQNQPKELLSFSPSRTRFPWGFLWDDGFHCQVMVRNDEKLVIKVIKSWLDTIEPSGWIPRQQNRGKQREHLCNCPRFMAKDIKDGNPPTLILGLEYLERKNKLNPKTFPIQYWQKIKMWYNWFLNTLQTSEMLFKWQDSIKNQRSSFTSGLDDFPRPYHSKGHVDLQSWMYLFSKFMSQAAPLYAESNIPYLNNLQKIKTRFHQFQDPSDHVMKDFDQDHKFSQHIGYPSILPIAFGILEQSSAAFAGTMKMIKQKLDTGYGLSSINMQDKLYLQNQHAYWRGPVWINMNYLLLKGLKIYYEESQSKYYEKLRKDLLSTVCGNYEKTGYFYENYIKGKGSFSFPFNGWTSLIAVIEKQNY